MRVQVAGTGRVFAIAPGEDLLEVFQSNDEPIATSCGGIAFCGTCWVTVESGADALVPTKPQELVHLDDGDHPKGSRLACQAQLRANVDPADDGLLVVRIPLLDEGL